MMLDIPGLYLQSLLYLVACIMLLRQSWNPDKSVPRSTDHVLVCGRSSEEYTGSDSEQLKSRRK